MSSILKYLKLFFVFIFIGNLFLLTSCSKVADEVGSSSTQPPTYELPLISATELQTVPPAFFVLLMRNIFPSQLITSIQYTVKPYKIIYQTQYKGSAVRASGIVFIPVEKTTAPWVSIQHGTIFSQDSAPSAFQIQNGIKGDEAFYMAAVTSLGFIACGADYLGYGESSSMVHPYHHYESTAQTTLDMLRATQSLLKNLKITTTKLFLAGYSEGGYATLALQKKIEEDVEFTITAVSAGAGAYDLLGSAQSFLSGGTSVEKMTGVSSFLIYAYNKVYGWNRPLTDFFQGAYAQSLENASTFDTNQYNLFSQASPNELINPVFLSACQGNGEQDFKNALTKNSVYDWKPISLLRLYHGDSDTMVPSANSAKAYATFIQRGATNVSLHYIAGADHNTAAPQFLSETLLWFWELVQ